MRKALSIACVVLCLPFMLVGMPSDFSAAASPQTDLAPPLPSPPADSAEREIKRGQIALMVRIKNKLAAEQQTRLRQLRGEPSLH